MENDLLCLFLCPIHSVTIRLHRLFYPIDQYSALRKQRFGQGEGNGKISWVIGVFEIKQLRKFYTETAKKGNLLLVKANFPITAS